MVNLSVNQQCISVKQTASSSVMHSNANTEPHTSNFWWPGSLA